LAFQGGGAGSVNRFSMLSSIEFDHQLQLVAVEIDDMWMQRMLPAPLEPLHASSTQVIPQVLLGVGGMRA
jgi:hypothetical protein